MGLVRSCMIRVMPCDLTQHGLSSVPVCVLHVLSATPVHPSSRPRRTTCQSRALVRREQLACRHAVHVNAVARQVIGKGLPQVEDHATDARVLNHQPVQDGVDILRAGLTRATRPRSTSSSYRFTPIRFPSNLMSPPSQQFAASAFLAYTMPEYRGDAIGPCGGRVWEADK